MKKNKAGLVITIIVAVGLIALFLYPKFTDPDRPLIKKWNDGGITCLKSDNVPLAQHFHTHLTISEDGVIEDIPANIGVKRSCIAEVHTHDGTGTIHIESLRAAEQFHLRDFFTVWDMPIERDGYALRMTVNGTSTQEFGNFLLADQQQIVLTYTKK